MSLSNTLEVVRHVSNSVLHPGTFSSTFNTVAKKKDPQLELSYIKSLMC